MGFSSSADLFYGTLVHDPEGDGNPELPWDPDEEDFGQWVTDTFSTLGKRPGTDAPYEDQRAYWDSKAKFLETIPVKMTHVGHHEYARAFLVLKGWGVSVLDYGDESVDPAALVLTDGHRATFATALETLGLGMLPEPAIHLAASYG